jgi:type IV pilus assembly protein PilM
MIQIPFLEKRILGIDLGSINTKIVEVVRKKDSFEIVNFGIIPIINFKESASYIYILEEQIGKMISEFISVSKVKAKEAVLNIPAPYVFSVNITVPNIPEKSLPQIIRFESQRQIPLGLEEIELDYRYVNFETETQFRQWLVYLVATPKNYLEKIKTILDIAKLKFGGYYPEYLAFETYFKNRTGVQAVIDLGHSYSVLSLIKDGKVIFGNRLKIRGYDWLDSVMRLTNYSEEEVLNFVYKKGFYFTPEEKELKELADNFLNITAEIISRELEKIENSFLLRIDKVYWTGGLSILPGFKEKIASRLFKYQQEVLLPTGLFRGDKFMGLKERGTIFSQALGVAFQKLMS